MTLTEHFAKNVETITSDATVNEAAAAMEAAAVGCLVVVDDNREPVGILSDRDLALRVVAEERDFARTRVAEVMSQPAITVDPEEPFATVVQRMRDHGIRRLPVVDEEGCILGMVSFDDLIIALSREFADLGETVRREYWRARGSDDVAANLHELTGFLGWKPHGRIF